jgi:hypothetical protein
LLLGELACGEPVEPEPWWFNDLPPPGTARKKDLPDATLSQPAVLPLAMPTQPSYAATVTGKKRLQKHNMKIVR